MSLRTESSSSTRRTVPAASALSEPGGAGATLPVRLGVDDEQLLAQVVRSPRSDEMIEVPRQEPAAVNQLRRGPLAAALHHGALEIGQTHPDRTADAAAITMEGKHPDLGAVALHQTDLDVVARCSDGARHSADRREGRRVLRAQR